MIHVGLIGLGVVNTGFITILQAQKKEIEKILHEEVVISKILVKNIHKTRDVPIQLKTLTDNFDDLLHDATIRIIIEASNDTKVAYSYIKQALEHKKSVVTANKAVVSKHFEELSECAAMNHVSFLYDASVGGGIPVIKPLQNQLVLNSLCKVSGILNGTCNFILSKMFHEPIEYHHALGQAQDLGYAETDPSEDVSGKDTLRKLRILATLCFKGSVFEEDIIRYGIEHILSVDVEYVKTMNATIKVLAEATCQSNTFVACVMPTIVLNNSYFALVNDSNNAICIEGDHVGKLTFYGAGAGALPTGNALWTDVLDITTKTTVASNPLLNRALICNNHLWEDCFYLRVNSTDPKVRQALETISDQLLTKENQLIIQSKTLPLSVINDIIKKFAIKEEDYFIARIIK